ncbi:hypothetical protein H4R35_004200 [Dimargaris xerosporica]|nr:hypothetical protein H4R35_004200 [Dimargaris xerosporica]
MSQLNSSHKRDLPATAAANALVSPIPATARSPVDIIEPALDTTIAVPPATLQYPQHPPPYEAYVPSLSDTDYDEKDAELATRQFHDWWTSVFSALVLLSFIAYTA